MERIDGVKGRHGQAMRAMPRAEGRLDASIIAQHRRILRNAGRVFTVLSVGVVPIYTLLFASNQSLLESNISIVGNSPGKYLGIIVWGFLCAAFFYAMLSYLFLLTGYDQAIGRALLYAVCTLLVLTVITPFQPEEKPVQASLHNAFAMSAALLVLALLLVFIRFLGRIDAAIRRRGMIWWLAASLLCGVLLLTTGISGLVEFILIATMCQLLNALMGWIYQSSAFDPVGALEKARLRRLQTREA